MQDTYAETYSKNQNIKKESVKRNERIKVIDQEIDSWKNLLNNSEKMSIELNERKNKQNLLISIAQLCQSILNLYKLIF